MLKDYTIKLINQFISGSCILEICRRNNFMISNLKEGICRFATNRYANAKYPNQLRNEMKYSVCVNFSVSHNLLRNITLRLNNI